MRKYHENTNLKAKRCVRKGEKKYKSKGLNLGVKKRARQGSNRMDYGGHLAGGFLFCYTVL